MLAERSDGEEPGSQAEDRRRQPGAQEWREGSRAHTGQKAGQLARSEAQIQGPALWFSNYCPSVLIYKI